MSTDSDEKAFIKVLSKRQRRYLRGKGLLFCWNVRGFNISSHRRGFKKWFKVNKLLFGGIIETHVKQSKEKKFITELLPGWSFTENYVFFVLGKIWVLWDPSVQVVVVNKSP